MPPLRRGVRERRLSGPRVEIFFTLIAILPVEVANNLHLSIALQTEPDVVHEMPTSLRLQGPSRTSGQV
jgi:hypothetical protein